ncbi:MAG: hypothetical protein IPL45_02130 [Actinomycetales bacterium]|nr:hypothetical protein [Actinomycetales bacterium]
MATQQIVLTAMPRGVTHNPADGTLPISVLVSPRLFGADTLGAFPDWLSWTQRLLDQPLSLEITTPTGPVVVAVDTSGLRPDLWAAMFDANTLVRSHTFDDYSDHAVLSWPQRYALSLVKGVYAEAGIELALPESQRGPRDEHGSRHRRIVRQLVDGLAVHWDDRQAERRRAFERDYSRAAFPIFPMSYAAGSLGTDGLLTLPGSPSAADRVRRERLAGMYAVSNHVPPGRPLDEAPPDLRTLIDFHQALTSLSSYPALMRDLGLILELVVPADRLALGGAPSGTLGVTGVVGADWLLAGTQTAPSLPTPSTRYVLGVLGDETTVFAAAPDKLGGPDGDLETLLGLVNLHPMRYGLAQIDVDGALHQLTMLAEAWDRDAEPARSTHPEVFDESTTIPALRSGGLSLFADARGRKLHARLERSKKLNDALSGAPVDPLVAEDLTLGYRLDVWDSHTDAWHSLHRRNAEYVIGGLSRSVADEEGFTELAATQAGPDPAAPASTDLYLHESVARWTGWSLSVPPAGLHLSADPDPSKALPNPNENEAVTPFPMRTAFTVAQGSLPSLRFGRRYRVRVRLADVCGNGLGVEDSLANEATRNALATPADPEGYAYLRYEPVAAPQVVVRDATAITGPGSSLHRLVIRTANSDVSLDGAAPDLAGSDRHLVPPRITVDLAEKLGMFDTPFGSLDGSAAMYALIAARDAGALTTETALVDGHERTYPIESAPSMAGVPHLPDVLARGVAVRGLPGAPEGALGVVGGDDLLAYAPLDDSVGRDGSVTLVGFGPDDWQQRMPLRLALADGSPGAQPTWDAPTRTLTVPVPRGSSAVVPLSSHLHPADLRLMGVWQWIREYVDAREVREPQTELLRDDPRAVDGDRVARVLRRAGEGGHWMLTPPTILTLVHAVQQPLGVPQLCSIPVTHRPYGKPGPAGDETRLPDPSVPQTAPEREPTGGLELATLSSWRRPGALDAYLLGGIRIHAASTEKVDLFGTWSDPVDDPSQPAPTMVTHTTQVDEVPVRELTEGVVWLRPDGPGARRVAYLDVDHDLLCLVRAGDTLGNVASGTMPMDADAAPRHHLGDTRHHWVAYSAVATSRYREYFPADVPGGLTRTSEPVEVHVPASTRPQAPKVAYVVPTFGWQRQSETNVKRSVRFGGGLRVFLDRGWFSSGVDEMLGVTLHSWSNGSLTDYEQWKPYVTQWGSDPIWQSQRLFAPSPGLSDLPGAAMAEELVSLDAPGSPLVDVAAYPVQFDSERNLWFADVTVTTDSRTYAPFVRLALCRYQPYALPDSKISRVVTADFAQLTPTRAAVVSADPYHPRRLRVTISGVRPEGPAPDVRDARGRRLPSAPEPTSVEITVQERRPDVGGELGWVDVPAGVAAVVDRTASAADAPDLLVWTGTVDFVSPAEPGRFRLLVCEYENYSANHLLVDIDGRTGDLKSSGPRRLVYAETVAVDAALVAGPPTNLGTVV